MTEQERLALSGIKGMLEAYKSIHTITIGIAKESLRDSTSEYMRGMDHAQIAVASKAIEQNLRLLEEVNQLLEETPDG